MILRKFGNASCCRLLISAYTVRSSRLGTLAPSFQETKLSKFIQSMFLPESVPNTSVAYWRPCLVSNKASANERALLARRNKRARLFFEPEVELAKAWSDVRNSLSITEFHWKVINRKGAWQKMPRVRQANKVLPTPQINLTSFIIRGSRSFYALRNKTASYAVQLRRDFGVVLCFFFRLLQALKLLQGFCFSLIIPKKQPTAKLCNVNTMHIHTWIRELYCSIRHRRDGKLQKRLP